MGAQRILAGKIAEQKATAEETDEARQTREKQRKDEEDKWKSQRVWVFAELLLASLYAGTATLNTQLRNHPDVVRAWGRFSVTVSGFYSDILRLFLASEAATMTSSPLIHTLLSFLLDRALTPAASTDQSHYALALATLMEVVLSANKKEEEQHAVVKYFEGKLADREGQWHSLTHTHTH